MEQNSNCLAGCACPNCGSLGPFIIPTIGYLVWDDSGVDPIDSEVEPEFDFAPGAIWTCLKCRTRHPMTEFKTEEKDEQRSDK